MRNITPPLPFPAEGAPTCSLQLSPHLHAVVLDGMYAENASFEPTPRPTSTELGQVASRIAERTERWLGRHGYRFESGAHEREPDYAEQSAQSSLRLGELATVDPKGRVTLLARHPMRPGNFKTKGVSLGFDLHADVSVSESDREGRERLCQYILRPPLVLERLSRTDDGRIAYERKYQSAGVTHVVMTPFEFPSRLSSLVFPPHHPMLRFHGVFAAHHIRRLSRYVVGNKDK